MVKQLKRLPDWFWLAALASVLRLVNLGSESIWFDEAFTYRVVAPGTDFWRAILGDDHPPLWSIIQWFNVRILGTSEFAFRLPPALLSIASVILIWKIAQRLGFTRRASFIAGFLVAVNPGMLYFAQDARMYAALTSFVLLCLYGVMRGDRRGIVLTLLGGIGAVYTHNVGVLYVLCIGIAAILKRGNILKSAVPFFLIAVVWSPWLIQVIEQMKLVKQTFWLLDYFSLGQLVRMWDYAAIGMRVPEPFGLHTYTAVIAMTVVSLIVSRRWLLKPEGRVFLAVMLGGPVLLALISIFYRNIYVYRPLLPATTASMLVWAYALSNMRRSNQFTALAIIVPCLILAFVGHYIPIQGRQDVRGVSAQIRAQWQPGDIIYHLNSTTLVTYLYYLPDLPQVTRPAPGDIITVTDESAAAMGLQKMDIDTLAASGFKRAWVIYEQTPVNRAAEVTEYRHIMAAYPVNLVNKSSPNELEYNYLYMVRLWQ